MAKHEDYTVENLARATDEAVIADAVSTIKGVLRRTRRAGESLMIAAAYATVAALREKVATKAELSREWGDPTKPLSVSTITLYDRLGQCAARLGIEPKGVEYLSSGKPVWSLLAGYGGATISAVGQYIENGPVTSYNDENKPVRSGEATFDGLIDLLGDYFGPDGVAIKASDRKINEAKREAAVKGVEYTGPAVTTPDPEPEGDGGTRTIEQKFHTAAELVRSLVAQMDESVWTATEADRNAMWEAMDKAHAVFTPKKAKKTA